MQRANMLVVMVHTDEGVSGYSNTNLGVGPITALVEGHLKPLVVGQNVFDTEMIWERMYRGTIALGRGVVSQAISLIDIALWDAKGKALGQPVYRLLGGKELSRDCEQR